ncbi:hypothetical protein SAMN06893096_108217 [Geodermatophilus pulveris]|uniref:Uncharacterized protein n=1 Tax=Geodermatophilus pulveris TaxID=1564159 RepID=A0A239HQ24_9ACTN|nr:hypothetical protein [Geodermatophilus pulveris]SNS83188.1 hypothetical protein SAMN06893096_108217 [Geodermatophilus pulveris]
MTAAPLTTEPLVLVDVVDLAEADLDADLAERLVLTGAVAPRADVPATAAEAIALARSIRGAGAAALVVHALGGRAAALAR